MTPTSIHESPCVGHKTQKREETPFRGVGEVREIRNKGVGVELGLGHTAASGHTEMASPVSTVLALFISTQ